MKVVEISRPGGPDVLVPVERPMPEPGPGEVLIRSARPASTVPMYSSARAPIRAARRVRTCPA